MAFAVEISALRTNVEPSVTNGIPVRSSPLLSPSDIRRSDNVARPAATDGVVLDIDGVAAADGGNGVVLDMDGVAGDGNGAVDALATVVDGMAVDRGGADRVGNGDGGNEAFAAAMLASVDDIAAMWAADKVDGGIGGRGSSGQRKGNSPVVAGIGGGGGNGG